MTNDEWLNIINKIDDEFIDELVNDQLHRNQANEKKSSGKEEVVLKPKYYRPDPSPKSGTAFKRVMIAAAAVVCVAAAGIFIRVKNKPQTVSPDDSLGALSGDSDNSDNIYEIDPIQLNEYLSKGYDSKKVKQYDKLNVYECSLMQLDKNAFLDFFSEPPAQNGTQYSTNSELGNFVICGNTKPEENKFGERSIMSYVSYLKNGMGSYLFIFDYFDKETNEHTKTNVLDFATREEIEKTVRGVLSKFGDIEFQLTTRVVTYEEFSEASKKVSDIDWAPAADFYCINGIMAVDGLPVTYGKNSYLCDDSVMIVPTTFYAIYTENGLVDFELNNVWNVGSVISESEILTLEDAEKIIAEQYPRSGQSPRKMIFGKAELFYRASYTKKDGLRLIPCWGFYINDNDPKITVNAITGEIL